MLQEHPEGFDAVVGKRKLVFSFLYLASEVLGKQYFQIRFVIYAEYFKSHAVYFFGFNGMDMVNRLYCPGSDSTFIVP